MAHNWHFMNGFTYWQKKPGGRNLRKRAYRAICPKCEYEGLYFDHIQMRCVNNLSRERFMLCQAVDNLVVDVLRVPCNGDFRTRSGLNDRHLINVHGAFMPARILVPGTRVRLREDYKKRLRAEGNREHVRDFGRSVGETVGYINYGSSKKAPSVDVRWLAEGNRFRWLKTGAALYSYHLDDLEIGDTMNALWSSSLKALWGHHERT